MDAADSYTVTFTVSDGLGGTASETITITVDDTNQVPTASAQSVTGDEDVSQTITLSGSDPDGDTLTYALASQPSSGTVTLNGSTATYTPRGNFSGSDSFTFTASDGSLTSSEATVSITVTAVGPSLTVLPSKVDLGEVRVGRERTLTVFVVNNTSSRN